MKKLTIDYTDLSMDAKWYDFKTGEVVPEPADEGVFIKIKPFPAEMTNVVIRDDGVSISGEQQKKLYDFCLQDWQGVVDSSGTPLECSAAIKDKVFEFKLGGIPDFVILKSREHADTRAAAEKN